MNLSSLVSLSRRAAIIMGCVFHMITRSVVYRTRYQYALKVFKTFVAQAGRYVYNTCIPACTCIINQLIQFYSLRIILYIQCMYTF